MPTVLDFALHMKYEKLRYLDGVKKSSSANGADKMCVERSPLKVGVGMGSATLFSRQKPTQIKLVIFPQHAVIFSRNIRQTMLNKNLEFLIGMSGYNGFVL